MNATEATADVFLTAFRALPKKERKFIVEKLLMDEEFIEDLTDIVIFEQRKNEPSRSINDYIANDILSISLREDAYRKHP